MKTEHFELLLLINQGDVEYYCLFMCVLYQKIFEIGVCRTSKNEEETNSFAKFLLISNLLLDEQGT
jgi:hypothetical protein